MRPSIMTSSLFEKPFERTKPRASTPHCAEVDWATKRLGARRNKSGSVVAPISCAARPGMRNTLLAASLQTSGLRDTDSTCWAKSSSTLILLSFCNASVEVSDSAAQPPAVRRMRPMNALRRQPEVCNQEGPMSEGEVSKVPKCRTMARPSQNR